MKKIIAICIFLLCCDFGFSQTNVFHSFPDSAFWRVDMSCLCQSNNNENYYYHYYFAGDTTINSNSYSKLFRDSVLVVGVGGPACYMNPWAYIHGYKGAVRQDSVANKVYYIPYYDSTEVLLYDYNLVAGDTVKGFLVNCTALVTNVDSVLIGNQYHKKWDLSVCTGGNVHHIIEGIGSDNGLIEPLNWLGWCYSWLVCVKDSSSTLFNSGVSSDYGCQQITEVNNEGITKNEIRLYPNPFSLTAKLEMQLPVQNATVTIENYLGQTVKQFNKISGSEITISRDNLPAGLYFVQVTQNNSVVTAAKFIIAD